MFASIDADVLNEVIISYPIDEITNVLKQRIKKYSVRNTRIL